ncbi:MAG: NADH-quinone oxidoreductase subunit J [Phycisphaerales bacterium]|nr:MAG: NADH-quinone oxidoreductase subunit J [Phycisphaerales bacterium]
MSPTVAYLLYALFALGGAGVYLALPRSQARPTHVAGLLLGAGAIVGGLMLLGTYVIAPSSTESSTNFFFYLFSAIALFAAARVVTHPKPVYSAVYFVAVAVAVAALVLLQGAEFLAIALIIVYAGAILVTYAFVIMLAQQTGVSVYDTRAREPFAAVVLGFAAMAAIAGRIADPNALPATALAPATASLVAGAGEAPVTPDAGAEAQAGNTISVGWSLMTKYVVVLELAGVLLLVGLVGAIALVKKKVPRDVGVDPEAPLGQIGKEVEPF